RHRHPRLHALPARPTHLPACLRPRRDARLLGGGDGAGGGRDARAEGDRERPGPRGRVPLPHHWRPRSLSEDGRALPAASARRGRARDAGGAGSRGRMREGRRRDELRPLEIVPNYLEQPHGSALISCGKTRVLCTASLEESVPRWLAGQGRGWLTAEYSLLPASTGERTQREARSGRQQGRTVEIQRLIGRSVRAVADMQALGAGALWVACDVLQADGGMRCASISGVFVAAMLALDRFGLSKALTGSVAAVSVGIVDGQALLDLDYEEDSGAEVDV